MKVKFWGTRGSVPVPGHSTIKYGGNTPCLEISYDDEHILILDAGTGIRTLGNEIINKYKSKKIQIFITHAHWDHIQGLPFFLPFFQSDYEIDIYNNLENGATLDQIINAQMQPMFFPVNMEVFKAVINFHKLCDDCIIDFGELKIHTFPVHHSKGTLSFKLVQNGKTIVFMTDNEIYYKDSKTYPNFDTISEKNSELIDFCKGADYLIHDCMYSSDDFPSKVGWGHSNNIALGHFAVLAKVKNLILFHYEPEYTDDKVTKLLEDTVTFVKKHAPDMNVIPATETLKIET